MSYDREDHARAVHVGVGLTPPLWTAFWLAAGAGAAYWWWNGLGRPAARESALSAPPDPRESERPSSARDGAAPVKVAPPELVMAHSPPPSDAPDHPAHPSDRAIPEPPPEMLAHTPPESVGVSFKPHTGFMNPTHDPDSVFPQAANEGDGSGGGVDPENSAGREPTQAAGNPRVILATRAGEPVFDPEALATEISVAALTAGEEMDDTAAPAQAIGGIVGSPAPPKPRSRKKPGTAPEA